MHVIFVEPAFPANQMEFVRGLHAVGAKVTGIGERPLQALPADLRNQMVAYERVGSVCNESEMTEAVRRIQAKAPVDRMEATVEAHVMPIAKVREACGIPGTSVETTWACRDKPTMKEILRNAGVATAQSTGAGTPEEAREFAGRVGYPLIIKPRGGAGASGTHKVTDDAELEVAIQASGLAHGESVAIEEFVEGHEGFYDTMTVDGKVTHDFVTHYYPNVLEAMRTRWISPQFIVTNRIDTAKDYQEVRELGRQVIEALKIDTAPTHMEWFFGPKGLKFSEIGCRPPGVGAWDLYCAANEMDLYAEWAMAICWGRTSRAPSRRYSAGIITLRPDQDGTISTIDGLDEIQREYGEWIIDFHLPNPGTPTQGVEAGYMANAWLRMRHPDFDELRAMLNRVGETVKVHAR
ncbi:MAG: carboxylate--amine ligase [Gemmatimonadota bacterium]|nr:MAG: carboxylate--amine ligase [Gemmatimonadota bacterium]